MPTFLSTFSAQVGDFELNATHDDGIRVSVETFRGWGSAGTTLRTVQRPRSRGAWAGESYEQPRSLTLAGQITAQDPERLSAKADELIAAFSLEETSLTVREGAVSRSIGVRRDGPVLIEPLMATKCAWSAQVIAPDPRKTATDHTGVTGLPVSTGGLTIPYTIPYAIEAESSAGEVSLVNPGNIQGRVVLRLDGPLTAPAVTHVASGKTIVFASSLTIPAGNFVVVDMDRHTVLENGTASRNGWVTGRGWSSFEPGDNTWTFSAAGGTGTLTVTATPSWQ